MNKEELFKMFVDLFPELQVYVVTYKKIGSKCLAITFCERGAHFGAPIGIADSTRIFLYSGPDNWQFGTKLWRKRPEKIPKKNKEGRNA